MTDDPRTGDAGQRNNHWRGDGGSTTRRTFLRAAGAGVSALAVGAGSIGTAAGDDHLTTPWLHRDGNLIRDPEGNKVVLRGVNTVDPARATPEWGHLPIDEYIDMATDEDDGWYARFIRLPMQPQDIGGHGPGAVDPVAFDEATLSNYLETYVDVAVERCRERGVYAILDYHRHYEWGPDWDDPLVDEEIRLFWNLVAPRYADDSHVLFEVYNEPTAPYPGAGDPTVDVDVTDPEAEQTWLDWRETAQPWVDLIRDHAPNSLILIGSPRWSQWTLWAAEHEFAGENLAYTGHVYTQENLRPLSTYFGEPSLQVPVFITEFGFLPRQDAPYLTGSRDVHGVEFREFFEEYDSVHWTAWCFDHTWEPAMLNHDYEIRDEWGEWVQDYLYEKRDDDLPQAPSDAPPGGTGSNDCEDGIEVGEYCATDPNGDGKYTDVNGNGGNDFDDVVTFFEEMQSDGVQNNVSAFDFNDNGGIDFDDVVALFETV